MGGVIFTVLTEPYLISEYGGDYCREAPVKLLECLLYKHKAAADEEVVVVNQVLASDVTVGYDSFSNHRVLQCNGVDVRNLRHLAEMCLSCETPFLRFDVDYNVS